MKCAMRLEAHALRPLKQCVALHEVYESIAGAFDGAKMRNESNAFLKRSAAAFVASERFLGLTPIGELMLERDGVEAVAWSADLLREGGVGGASTGQTHSVRAEAWNLANPGATGALYICEHHRAHILIHARLIFTYITSARM